VTRARTPGSRYVSGRFSAFFTTAAAGAAVALLAPSLASSQTGTLAGVRKGGRAKVVWNSKVRVAPGRLGVVLDERLAVALIRVTQTGAKSSHVEGLDLLAAGSLRKGEKVRLAEETAAAPSEGLSTLLVWSGPVGSPLLLDGKEAGVTPVALHLTPGPHEILLKLPEGDRLGAVVDLSVERERTLFLNGRHMPGVDPERLGRLHRWDPRPPSATRPREDAPAFLTLEWIEAPGEGRVYLPCIAIRPPGRVGAERPDSFERGAPPDPESRVILEGVIRPDGRFDNLRVITSRSPELADRALEAVGRWTYDAATLGGERVPVLATVVLGAVSPAPASGE